MQSRNDTSLQNRSQIDQQVPATYQIEIGKRWVFDQVLFSKNAHIPNRFIDLKSAIQPDEEPLQALGGNLGNGRLSVEAGARPIQSGIADIGGENLDGGGGLRNVPAVHPR